MICFFITAEALLSLDPHRDLQSLMDTTYLEISRRVLDVLNSKYKFMEHMQALRRYLLLGQGDFIRHLMELLEYVCWLQLCKYCWNADNISILFDVDRPELRKPASEINSHNLTSILDSAIRSTNAQYEDASILRRLDVRLLEQCPGDTGWDIFSMDYNMEGPIGTVSFWFYFPLGGNMN